MAGITAAMVKELREMTGAGPLDCKKALEENDGDLQKAAEYLREKGIAKAQKKLGKGRTMNEGVVEVYQHFNKRLAVIVEVNCETDFVANTDQFQSFAKDVALHISSMRPHYVKREDVPADKLEYERNLQLRAEDLEGKPENIKEKIVEGRLDKWFKDIVLMEQEFLKDDSKTIAQLLEETVAAIGESVQISRFSVFALGEDDEDAGEEE
ncbi:translation elongation factor Ts [Phototrophicus methaneseepsis]|uniref:Elongation factor Ts n=1 Tax=Phototrophicus methaneseepsis TaxID=2710758 RepID=A0A7S8EAM9_9CHLR|nr:translation elongation factor Ts [Phototrophicus methaneseepsis]QPC83424.1 translation elongation factor Ts [Phototrophicus methaneseepsis]